MRSKVNVVEPSETVEEERQPRYSIADLQSRRVVTTQRQQLLHRQFSDTYAETLRNNALIDANLPHLNKASSSTGLSQQIDNASSPAATPEPSADLVRPFGASTGKLDIEQAINLLQELKKTASPEELVSLHRALLPVKEVSPMYSPQIGSPKDSTFSTAIPPERRRSVMPPGLATRSGHLEDILRKQDSCAAVHTASKERREMWVHADDSAAGENQNNPQHQSTLRPETPSERPNTGAYNRGTLRITNGAASPEPSIISKIAAEESIAELGSGVDLKFGQLILQSERLRPSGPRHPQRQSKIVQSAELDAFEQQRPRSASASDPSAETRRPSIEQANSLPTSPLKARFQQRWSHRAAHLSQQYLSDCDIGGSPFDEKSVQSELIKRLSAVPDVESEDSSQNVDAHADAMHKLTGDEPSPPDVDTIASELPTMQANDDVHVDPPTRALRKVDSGYQSDMSNSQHQPFTVRGATYFDPSSVGASLESRTSGRDQNDQTSYMPRTSLHDHARMHTWGEDLARSRTGTPQNGATAKRSSPLAFLRRNKTADKSSISLLSDVTSPPPASDADPVKQSKRLQKRAPKSVRDRRQLEADMQAANEENKGSIAPTVSVHSSTKITAEPSETQIVIGQNSQSAATDAAGDGAHRSRLRGKSFGRKRSKTNSTEHDVEIPASPMRARVKRSISSSSHNINVFSDSNHGTSCMSSVGEEQKSPDRPSLDFQTVARALSSHPPYTPADSNQSVGLPKSVHGRSKSRQENPPNPQSIHPAVHELPQNIPMPLSPPRATFEGFDRVIPIGANGSVEDLFPEWQSRPATTPSPKSTPSPNYLQIRQAYKSPRSPLSTSNVPPLPELPADIESKLTRADQMVAKRMLNSPRNSARNSPLSSMRNSEDSTSSVKTRRANRLAVVQDTEVVNSQDANGTTRWSVDGTMAIPQAGGKSQPASPTHDTQHPGWPGWEKQADLWRQRRADLGHTLNRSVDVSGKILVESEQSPNSTPTAISRQGTPVGVKESTAEKLAQSYAYLFTDDKENQPAQQNVQRTDSVDSSATTSSEDRSAMLDISRNGSAYSSASSDPSMGRSPSPAAGKTAMHAKSQSFTPYRAADAVQAERSRALSRARRTCNIPPGSLYLVQSQNASMPQVQAVKETAIVDRYSGGLGYGWDRSTGFGGSAGTVSSGTEIANRKSVKISEDYGLDLSDVPVFLRKAHTGNF